MLVNLYYGMQRGLGPFRGWPALVADLLLIVQFPLVHSWLLGRRGRSLLGRLAPASLGRDLSTTTFAIVAAVQLALVFLLWSPSGIVWWEPLGRLQVVYTLVFAAAWIFLAKALWDAGLPLQTGLLGWMAVFRNRAPEFGDFPTRGLYRFVRQPVYIGFALILLTAPVWTPDRLALAVVWTAYCVVGPRLKERRYARRYGEPFRRYQAEVPYFVPLARRPVPAVDESPV